jgi:hypothetical protein
MIGSFDCMTNITNGYRVILALYTFFIFVRRFFNGSLGIVPDTPPFKGFSNKLAL